MGRLSGRVGIGIGSDAVRAVVVRGRSVVWTAETTRVDGEPFAATLRRVLSVAPLPRWRKAVANVALGPSLAQTKRLCDLPQISDSRTLARVVAEGSARFFLRTGAPLLTVGVRLVRPGEGWAAAFERPLIEELHEACRLVRVRLRAVAPAVAVLGLALETDEVSWFDGDVRADVEYDKGQLRSVRRLPRSVGRRVADAGLADADTAPRDNARFADALGAALLPRREPLALRFRRMQIAGRSPARWRGRLAAAAAVVSLAASATVPWLSAKLAATRAQRALVALKTEYQTAVLLEAEVARNTAELEEWAKFARPRPTATRLLADLARVLPRESALIALRTDSSGGTLVALSARGGSVLSAMETMPSLASPEIFGPVTREVVNGREYERVTIRYRFAAVDAPRNAATSDQ